MWGCKPKLQKRPKAPKMESKGADGTIFWFSDKHSSLVANVCNLRTGYISPQFHLVFDDLFETVIYTADDDIVFDAICNDLFELNRDWYAEDEFDENEKLIYRPPPLKDVWLDEQGQRNRQQEMENQRRRREDHIHKHNRAIPVPDIIPLNKPDNTPFTGAPISDDESSDSSVGVPSESEGDLIAITDEGPPSSPPPAPNISQPSQPSPLNTSPEGDTSHEGAPAVPRRKNTRKQCPEAVWERGRDGKMKCVELNKLNRQLYALTFGPKTVPPMAQKMSKKKMRLNYKQYKRGLRENGDRALQNMSLVDQCPTVAELMASPLARYITLAANDCGYSGPAEELIVDYVHPLFLKAKSSASREDNPNWREAT